MLQSHSAAGAAPIHRLTTFPLPPPAPPALSGLIYSPAILLNPGSAISSGHAPKGGDGELVGEDFPSEETRLLGCYEPAQ